VATCARGPPAPPLYQRSSSAGAVRPPRRGRSASSWRPSSSMPARRGGDSAACVPRQPGSAAATSGRGPNSRASRSATAGGSRWGGAWVCLPFPYVPWRGGC